MVTTLLSHDILPLQHQAHSLKIQRPNQHLGTYPTSSTLDGLVVKHLLGEAQQ